MDNKSCLDGHKYGLWNEENGMAVRKCQNCSHIEQFPLEEEYKNQMRLQKEALIFFEAFQKSEKNDTNLIGYLYTILDDYVNYLDVDNKNILIHQMEELSNQDIVSVQNGVLIRQLSSFLKGNKIEEFYDVFEQFKEQNMSLFENVMLNNEVNGYQR